MPSVVNVAIHSSQFPEAIQLDLLESLRTRRVNHKFHYDSVEQTQKWLALHQAFSPSRNDDDCARTYDQAFTGAAAQIKASSVHLIGLGCGGGQKDTRLLKLLKRPGRKLFYTPSDVSVAMTLVAREAAMKVVAAQNCFPLVCDLASTNDLAQTFAQAHLDTAPNSLSSPKRGEERGKTAARIITFFGMIPNFEPHDIMPKLAKLIRHGDTLLFSANLAPGNDYTAGMKHILPQYDNALTRDWLMTFLLHLGFEWKEGQLRFAIEATKGGLMRVVANFRFKQDSRVTIGSKQFNFKIGDSIRLFFSYRYTPERVRKLLNKHGLQVHDEWITKSGEEGVFLCRRRSKP